MSNIQTGVLAWAKLRPLLVLWLSLGMWSLFAATRPVEGAEPAARIESVRVGFRGVVEVGRWNSVSVRVTGASGTEVTPRIISSDVDGRPVRQPGLPVVLAGGTAEFSLVYQHGPLGSPVAVEIFQGNDLLDQVTLRAGPKSSPLHPVTQQTDFILCLGKRLVGFERAAERVAETRQTRSDRVAPLIVQSFSPEELEDLPPDARGWESVDVCVVPLDCAIPRGLGRVLKEWVHRGGRLVLIGGTEATMASESALTDWSPVQRAAEMNIRDPTSLNSLVPGSATLRLRTGSLRTISWETKSGAVLCRSLDGPLLVRAGVSLGTVTGIAVDIDELPFVERTGEQPSVAWESLPDLCRILSGLPLIPKLEEGGGQRPQSDLAPTGVSDLQTQLINSLDQFPEIVRPSYWVVLGTALLFLLIAGPLDYLLVHRLLKRPHWTWVTLPIWISLGTLSGLSAAARTGGSRELTRQLDLVTWDAELHEVHLNSWLTIYSPRHHRFEVSSQPSQMAPGTQAETHLRWAGRPEEGFRGLYRETPMNSGAHVEQGLESRTIRSLPIRHGASSVVEVKSRWEESPPITNELLDPGNGTLEGTFSHRFKGELVDWVLAYGNFAYFPSRSVTGVGVSLKAGETIRADLTPSRLLRDYLKRLSTRSVLRTDGKTTDFSVSSEEYDPLSRDFYPLLRTTTFYEALGGQSYTTLTNTTLQNEDLTRLVDARRAVVFGRWKPATADGSSSGTETHWAQYTVDGQPISSPIRECFVRWILPVRLAAKRDPSSP